MVNERSALAGEAGGDDAPVPTSDATAIPSGSAAATRAAGASPTASPVTQRKTRVTLADGSRVIDDYAADGTTLADQRAYDASGSLILFELFAADGRPLRSTATAPDGSTTTSIYTSNVNASGVLTKTFTQNADGSRTIDDYGDYGYVVFDRRTYDPTGNLTSFTSFLPYGQLPSIMEATGTPAPGTDIVGTGTSWFGFPTENGPSVLSSVAFDPSRSDTLKAVGTLVAVIADQTVHSDLELDEGDIDWTFVAPAGQLEFLAPGQTVQETFDVTLTDQHGSTSVTPISVVLTGTNDAPVFVPEISGDPGFGLVTQVDAAADGTPANEGSDAPPVFSPDSAELLFDSSASNLAPGDTNAASDVFIKDLATGAITRVSTTASGEQANGSASVFSPDGSKVAFVTTASDLLPIGATEGIVVKDLGTGAVTSVASTTAADGTQPGGFKPVFSTDGTKLAFLTTASELLPAGASEGIVVKDLATGAVTPVATVGPSGSGSIGSFALSPDGTKVAFDSDADDLVPGDTDGMSDVFVEDLTTGAITRVSDTTTTGERTKFPAIAPVWSPDGTEVAFSQLGNGYTDDSADTLIYVDNLPTGDLTIVGSGRDEVFSPDSTQIALTFIDDNELPNDPSGHAVLVRNLVTGNYRTVTADLESSGFGDVTSDHPVFLPDGTSIAFVATSPINSPYGADRTNIFIENLLTGSITRDPASDAVARVSTAAGDVEADGSSDDPVISADGTKLAFVSAADNLVPGDHSGPSNIFVKDIDDALTATPALTANDNGRHAVVSATGRLLFTDPDGFRFDDHQLLDAHTVAVTAAAGDLGTLTATEARDSSGPLTGVIALGYQVTHATASATLAAGQTRTDTFTVEVADGYGGMAKQTVSVALTEAESAPATASLALAEPSNEPATTDASDLVEGSSAFTHASAHIVDVHSSGQTLTSDLSDTLRNHGAPDNTFVFDPGFGQDIIDGFRVGGTRHDLLDLPASDFTGIAEVLRNTQEGDGSVIIVDPTSGDTVKLVNVSKAELKANRGDFVFSA